MEKEPSQDQAFYALAAGAYLVIIVGAIWCPLFEVAAIPLQYICIAADANEPRLTSVIFHVVIFSGVLYVCMDLMKKLGAPRWLRLGGVVFALAICLSLWIGLWLIVKDARG